MTDILNLTLRDLRRAEPLIRRKEKLLAKLQGINRQLEAFNGNGHAVPRINGVSLEAVGAHMAKDWHKIRPSAKEPSLGRPGSLIGKIRAKLHAQGVAGLSINALAAACKVAKKQVQATIAQERTRNKQIERIGRGVYRWRG